ncbi:rarD protein [Oribacterium sp. KHPX15]|uniref:DMT family transporter n=1 Tax=unclassified Oribacterium TaxID=2629782 RepID=UPI0004E112C5|nr:MULTISPECIES: DMT family transporter [unclassified Oribacterium]SEA79510.1 rarD protein [Oribacterium sp. KHPX15]
MQEPVNERKSVLMNIVAMLIFGTIGIFRRYIPVSSAFLAFSRGLLGGLFLLIFIMVFHRTSKEKSALSAIVGLVISGAVMGVNWMLLFEAYNHTTVAVATLCYYMQPTIVVLLSPIIFKERLKLKECICAIIAILGMVLVSGVIGGERLGTGNMSGILFGLGAAVFYSIVIIINKIIRGIEPYQKTVIQLFSAGMVMIPYMVVKGGFFGVRLDLITIILLFIVGLVHTGIAYVLYFGSMDGLRAQSVAILSYIDPVSALLFSAFLLKEPLNIAGIIGAIMIIGSAVISEMQIGLPSGK